MPAGPLAVGCRAIGGPATVDDRALGWAQVDSERSIQGLHAAIERGANLFDVSDVFGHGHAERLLGRVLREYRREDLRIVGRVGWVRGSSEHPFAGTTVRRQFEQTLENLRTDYLDVYCLDHGDFGPDDDHLGESLAQMQALREDEHVRAIAMRGPDPVAADPHAAGMRFARLFRIIRPEVVSLRFNGLCPATSVDGEDMFAFTARHGVGLLLHEPLGLGVLTGKYDPACPPSFGKGDGRGHEPWFTAAGLTAIEPGLRLLRDRFGRTPGDLARVALQHCLRQADHAAVLVGFTCTEQIVDNHQRTLELDDAELDFVDETYRGMRTALSLAGIGPAL
jgi:aryl-alcohol dehydrogenase-like predicted oxidoreductase